MISHTAEYALRAMVCLSVDWKAPKTTHEIADQTKIPQGYLPKVMQQLGRAGLVQAQRGIYGGYSLKRHPSLVTLWESVSIIYPDLGAADSPNDFKPKGEDYCALHWTLRSAMGAMQEVMEDATLTDLLDGSRGCIPLGLDLEDPDALVDMGAFSE